MTATETADPSNGCDLTRASYDSVRESWRRHVRQYGLSDRDHFGYREVLAYWAEHRPHFTDGDDWFADVKIDQRALDHLAREQQELTGELDPRPAYLDLPTDMLTDGHQHILRDVEADHVGPRLAAALRYIADRIAAELANR